MNRAIKSYYDLPDKYQAALSDFVEANPEINEFKLIGSFFNGLWHDKNTNKKYIEEKRESYKRRGKNFTSSSDIDIAISGDRKKLERVGIIDVFHVRAYDIYKGVEIFKDRKFK